ncbi:excinuclease ABC subunit UvrA [Candidatus Uhrbacteria bacterium]|nr:excinuclease ABC subunit UvrA [Candidatus Uhrbacteria bacterium]
MECISIRGAREHNLKNINVDIPINALTVVTGLSGSGKSSLAFDTLYAEGQRRYVESLSAYARQFLGVMSKPDVDSIKGLSPAIAIQQKKLSSNPRSTVGTVTELYDYLRLLYARIGTPHCPNCSRIISHQDAQSITKQIIAEYKGNRVQILSPLIRARKGTYDYLFSDLKRQGFIRVRVDGVFYNLGTESILLKRYVQHTIEVVVDRLVADAGEKSRLQEAVESALKLGNGFVVALAERSSHVHDTRQEKKIEEKVFSQHLACIDCGINFDELQPRMFSFNAPQGACPKCHGIGAIQEFDEHLIIQDPSLSLMDGAIAPWKTQVSGIKRSMVEHLAKYYGFDPYTPIEKLPRDVIDLVLNGSDADLDMNITFKSGSSFQYRGSFEGVIPQLRRMYNQTDSDERRAEIERFMRSATCPECIGKRLKPESLAVTIGEKSIIETTEMSIRNTYDFFDVLPLTATQEKIARQVIKEIKNRLSFLLNVGLDYLTLSRSAGTLSGGEAQRIHLATQIGSELRGVLYILDEPSIGLHQRDNHKLIGTLKNLRDIGNTIVVVEHDEETMRECDHIIDIGPGAGVHGGEVIAQGLLKDILKSKKSLTADYLSGRKKIEVPSRRRKPRGFLTITDAHHHNLKHIEAKFPLSVFTCITGVSGSGKSTLISETLYRILAKYFYDAHEEPGTYGKIDGLSQLDKAIIIDQAPIGRTPRSNPATYTGLFTYVRELFAATKEARMRGYSAGRFSFNVAEGRCGNCDGDGLIKIEMHFLPDVYIMCEVCEGKRYDEETLSIKYKEKTIADVLAMTIDEALAFFSSIPRVKNKLQTLVDVGLGYLQLGQSATTLSGGEAQRIKLATELSRRDTGRTLYLLDEPTTGLHFEDVRKLIAVLQRLVEKENSVMVIEHNLDVLKVADYIIDLGPEGGDGGGTIVAQGTPEEVAKVKGSYTGQYLKKVIGDRFYRQQR